MTNDGWDRRRSLVLSAILVAIAGLIAADLAADYGAGTPARHLLSELAVMLGALGGVALLWRDLRSARAAVSLLESDVQAARRDAERWRGETREMVGGLRAAMDRQFGRWGLTAAERDVALLLLNGRSHKEIAMRRQTSERTVRQQAQSVYDKGRLSGRSALAAFFLEALLTPVSESRG
jgi:DNA-binding CsgD family transcriptional regulator